MLTLAAAGSGILLMSMGVAKMRDRRSFVRAISTWGVFPVRRVQHVAIALPVYEVIVGGAFTVACGIRLVSSAAMAEFVLVLLCLLMAATSLAFLGGHLFLGLFRQSADCGCAGAASAAGPLSWTRAAAVGVPVVPALLALL